MSSTRVRLPRITRDRIKVSGVPIVGRLGLRSRVMLTFAVGALLVSLVLAVSVYTISRGYLTEQRERSAGRQAAADADYVRGRLERAGASASEVLTAVDPPANTVLLLRWRDQWFTSEPNAGPHLLPSSLHDEVAGGTSTTVPVTIRGEPFFVVAIPLDTVGATFYEFTPLQELQSTLGVLRTVLIACAMAATLGGAMLGLWASRRVLQPLRTVADTAATIAGGQLDTRLPGTSDRDLAMIVNSFNSMVDSLQQRIERERRFFADVSHELRTPLTTLVASVGVLHRNEHELPDRSRRALHLVVTELDHLRRLLDDLLDLAKTEAGLHQDEPELLSVQELLTHTIARSGRPAALLSVEADSTISGRKLALERAFVNLMDNADKHGGGLVGLSVRRANGHALIFVDDTGPGIPVSERDRIFERFATGRAGRGSAVGTGLGLALVAETISAHGGQVRCDERPGGGARFVINLPTEDNWRPAPDDRARAEH
ncbi:MAG: HAMP domain-containing histidine kinase [Actinomycetota bacterium]|nr:HAMP domain-containing histidine kinase [Actinomycetota bacterium]